jgi:hypothetical protein
VGAAITVGGEKRHIGTWRDLERQHAPMTRLSSRLQGEGVAQLAA